MRWKARARSEFSDACRELHAANPRAAIDWQDAVLRMMEMLENHPQIGSLCRHDPDGEIRQVIVGRYRFIYRFNRRILELRRVRHVRRDYNPQVIRDAPRREWSAFVL